MSIKYCIIILCCFTFFFSCEKIAKTTFSDVTVSSENNSVIEVNIPKANGKQPIANTINSEIQNVVLSALHIGDPDNVSSKTIEEGIRSFHKNYKNFIKDFPESPQVWDAQIDGEVLYESEEITTISITSYVNTGGAHGILNISFLNFDNSNGQRIINKDLFKDIDGFKKIAQIHFKETIKEKDVIFENNEFELPTNIAYTEDGIVLLYNTYEIAPYSTGIIEFAIPFKKANAFLVFNGSN